jgi:hypothetical protein
VVDGLDKYWFLTRDLKVSHQFIFNYLQITIFMSYKNTPVFNNTGTYLHYNYESVIHINKYRFPDFYYEELDKLNKNYYHQPSGTSILGDSLTGITQSIEEEPGSYSESQPINIPNLAIQLQPSGVALGLPRRQRLDSLNNFINSPPPGNLLPANSPPPGNLLPANSPPLLLSSSSIPDLDMSMSPKQPTLLTNNSDNSTLQQSLPGSSSSTGVICGPSLIPELHIPSASQQMIVKRVYDNYITFNIDSFLANINITPGQTQAAATTNHTKYAMDTAHDFICDQLGFMVDLLPEPEVASPCPDPFNLFNISTIGLLFDRMNKSRFSFRLAYIEIIAIIRELSARNAKIQTTFGGASTQPVVKQSILDAAIGILHHTAIDLLQPGLAVAQPLVKSLGDFIDWIYSNYGRDYWMTHQIVNASYNLATDLSARFGVNMVGEIYKTIRLYFVPSHLFSVSRAAWKFTNIHRRQINKLRGVIIQPSAETHWIIKCLDQTMNIPWVYPDTPHIRNIIVFVDGRNWFYSSGTQTSDTRSSGTQTSARQTTAAATNGGIDLDLFRKFIHQPEYKMIFTELVYNRITELMTSGRQLTTRDPRFIIPVFIFNEKHRHQIQALVPNNHNIIYTPRGRNDDLMTLYLWLSNPGSFIASNDNFGEHAARIQQYTHQPKYFEGLWIQMVQCFKLINPFPHQAMIGNTNINHHGTNKLVNKFGNNQPGTSAPF